MDSSIIKVSLLSVSETKWGCGSPLSLTDEAYLFQFLQHFCKIIPCCNHMEQLLSTMHIKKGKKMGILKKSKTDWYKVDVVLLIPPGLVLKHLH